MATQISFALSSSTASFGTVVSGDTITGGASLVDAHRILVAAPVGGVAESQIADAVSGAVLSLTATLTGARSVTFPDASLTVAGQNYANIFTAAQNVRHASGITVTQASTQDGVALVGRAGGTSSYVATLTPTTLTASRTLTLPDGATMLAGLALAQTWTATQAFAAITATTGSFSGQLTSTLATGSAPFVVASTTLVANLYAARAALSDAVTTNANLTGVITSVGNATSIASQTGTGTKFVVDNGPTLIAPILGAATGTSLSVSGQLTSTVATGTAPLAVSSTTVVSNLNASLLLGATWAAPAAIGGSTPAAGTFTALAASSVTNSGLTAGRLALVTTAGLMTDAVYLTYSSQTLTVGDGTAAASLVLSGLAATTRDYKIQTAGVNRWVIRGEGTAEAGANAGTYLQILARADDGSAIDTVLQCIRASGGAMSINRPLSVNAALTATSITNSALTATRVVYSGASGLGADDSGFTRASLALTVDSGSDGTYIFGNARCGLATGGTAGVAYWAHGSVFTNVSYALLQDSSGDTFLNAKSGAVLALRINNGNQLSFSTTVATFAATTEASAVGTAAVVVSGGLSVAKRSYLGTIGSTFKGNVDAGVQDGTTAVAGQVGEVISSVVSTYTNYTTTATIQQLTSIALTAGDWMLYATVTYYGNSATNAADGEFVSYLCDTTASATGAVEGDTLVYQDQPVTGTLHRTVSIAYHENISASKTKYLNGKAAFTLGNPQYTCTLRAVRIR